MLFTLDKFYRALGLEKPMVAIQGDIFNTPANHIVFAVHWPNSAGHFSNDDGGFSSEVAKLGWPELATIKFKKGETCSKEIQGKTFHAIAVHTPEEGGWDETPQLIKQCLDQLPVNSEEVIACVLIGGGEAGMKYKASVKNIEGMLRSYKTTVLYVYDYRIYELLQGTGVINQPIPLGISLADLPKVKKYREQNLKQLAEIYGATAN